MKKYFLILCGVFLFSSSIYAEKINIKKVIHRVYNNFKNINTFKSRITKELYYNKKIISQYKGNLITDNKKNYIFIHYFKPESIDYISADNRLFICNHKGKYFANIKLKKVSPTTRTFFMNAQKISFNVFYLLGNYFKFKFKRVWKNKIIISGTSLTDKKGSDKFSLLIGIDRKLPVVRVVELFYEQALVYQIVYSDIKKIKNVYIPKRITSKISVGGGLYSEEIKYNYIRINPHIDKNIFKIKEKEYLKKGYEKLSDDINTYFY